MCELIGENLLQHIDTSCRMLAVSGETERQQLSATSLVIRENPCSLSCANAHTPLTSTYIKYVCLSPASLGLDF